MIARLRRASFPRFCLVGAAGFAVDAAVLAATIHGAGMPAIPARLVSFACAVGATYQLNRRWAFPDAATAASSVRIAAYLSTQSVGFACNLAVYATLALALRPSHAAPFVALAAGSATALVLNYTGARLLVFRRVRA